MLKAIFIDYTGTMVKEDEPYTRELIAYFIAHSNLKSPGEILKVVWSKVKEIESESHGDSFEGVDVRTDRILEYCRENCGLQGDFKYMHEVWSKIWVHAPLYEDVKHFFEHAKLPIYVLTNDDLCYVEESMRLKGLKPAGIISAETAKACKPDPAIFKKALEVAGVSEDEVIHIGDSVTSDVEPAVKLGITPIYLSRGKKTELQGVRVIGSLDELEV
ncbi:MAG: HAD family hydrolase [Lachnospiraceae bacterium]|nr:HAD family hydrolase [Lachnospiraceae bacterium]